MSFMQDLANAYNQEVANERAAANARYTPTGSYTATVEAVEAGLMRDNETPKLNLTLNLSNENGQRAGKTWLDITPVEQRKRDGKLRRETTLFYDLMKLSGADGVEEFVALLENGMLTFSLYGTEYFNAPVDKLPLELIDAEYLDEDGEPIAGKWQMTFIDADDEDGLRDQFLAAGQKSRFMVLRVGRAKHVASATTELPDDDIPF